MLIAKTPCPNCGKLMNTTWLADKTEKTYTQFAICYCPYCIKLGDKIETTCWARTEIMGCGKNE